MFNIYKVLHKLIVNGTKELVSGFDFLQYQEHYRERLKAGQLIDPLVAFTSLSTHSLNVVAIPAQTAATHILDESSFQASIANTILNCKPSPRETNYRESLLY